MPPLTLPSWLKIKPHREPVTQLHVPRIKFLGEQDGPVERTVKARWLPILSESPEIRRAFLVRASYEAPNDVHVVLALCSNGGPDRNLIEALRVPYAAIFSRDCPLDMAFVNASQESDIERVCPPFYTAV
jgi:hypothetical protein